LEPGRLATTTLVFFLVGLALSAGLVRLDAYLSAPDRNADGRGSAVESARPRRIVCYSPSITETVFALGAGDRVVGVDDFSSWPLEARNVPRVGGFINPNFERLLALAPDLVVVQGRQEKVEDFCAREGIAVLHMEIHGLASFFDSLRRLGVALGIEEEAESLERRIQKDINEIRAATAGRPRPAVFLAVSRRPGSLAQIMTVGKSGYLNEVMQIAGGRNIYADVDRPYPMVSKETLVARRPDVIIEARAGEKLSAEQKAGIRDEWRVFGSIPAVRAGRIYVLTEDYLLLPGPRIARCARKLAEAFHPELAVGKRGTR